MIGYIVWCQEIIVNKYFLGSKMYGRAYVDKNKETQRAFE
jgi:hypothetical protein